MRPFLLWLALAGATLAATLAATRAAAQPGPPATPPSATAEAIYRDAKPRLLQIRTLLNAASQKSSTGSGFLISADGLAITNYHVVSQHAMEPQTYRMEYVINRRHPRKAEAAVVRCDQRPGLVQSIAVAGPTSNSIRAR
jgi:S1-C subfamily serine protease